MSKRYQAAILTASYNGLKVPNAPTIGTATSGGLSASVTFTAPSNVGGGAITSYTVISSPGGITGVGASSPVTVSGLTSGVSYTFTVVANNVYGSGPASAASNSITAVDPNAFIENLFSTYLYTGNGSTQTITNSIDLSTKGGLVWIKRRDGATSHALYDTARGVNNGWLTSNTTDAAYGVQAGLDAFLTTGFSLGDGGSRVNTSSFTYASWTFRKQAKFFDVVTYTGNGTAGRQIAHSLGSTPGFLVVKNTATSGTDWDCWHRSIPTSFTVLNATYAANAAGAAYFGNGSTAISPTSTVFTVSDALDVNASGQTYVAYLFAHDAGGFGTSGTDNVISCGSFTTDSSGNASVTLGYEPQWLMTKTATTASSGAWYMQDNMRGWVDNNPGSNDNKILYANTSGAEGGGGWASLNATGFTFASGGYAPWANQTFIYIAIRRGPMAVPTSGTSVYNAIAYTGNDASNRQITGLGFPPDLALVKATTQVRNYGWEDRLRGADQWLVSSGTDSESSYSGLGAGGPLLQNGITVGANGLTNEAPNPYILQAMRRAPSFFDEVCYTGDSTTPRNITHNLGVAPELILVKSRSNTRGWAVYSSAIGAGKYLILNGTYAALTDTTIWANTSPTSSVFTVGNPFDVNNSGYTYVAYLFATCTGVSKVGSYTGTGATQTISCGFTGGARFVLVKRTDSTGDWYVWDTARGMVSGTDPSLLLNSTAAEVNANSIYTTTGGFQIVSTAAGINASGGTYIYLAIA